MADPALPQALADDPSRRTAVAPARDPDIPPPAVAPAREAAASPAAGEPRYPGLGAKTEQDHLAIAADLGVKAPRFSQAEQPERFAAWSDRVDQLLIHAQRNEPEQFEALKREANAYGGHPQPAEPLERPTPQGLREIAQAPGLDAPGASEAASSGRGQPESRQPGGIADPRRTGWPPSRLRRSRRMILRPRRRKPPVPPLFNPTGPAPPPLRPTPARQRLLTPRFQLLPPTWLLKLQQKQPKRRPPPRNLRSKRRPKFRASPPWPSTLSPTRFVARSRSPPPPQRPPRRA